MTDTPKEPNVQCECRYICKREAALRRDPLQPSDWALPDLLDRIEAKATGGLCQFGVAGKHAFLSDIRVIVEEARAAITTGATHV